ncbi:MAG TPA: gliding motility-associated C-terminal domain-containing protein [Lentimicrobium sp.]|nr:gliding motility-associated C-terminal domain-containing protein [Lentimicrobium sp.]
MKRFTLITLLLLSGLFSFAQGEWNNWYFGKQAGLSFNSGSPVPLTAGANNSVFGCASISDSLGNLLFYTDGVNVYNNLNLITPNGSGLFGSGTQGTIILPAPDHESLFYIVTVFNATNNIAAIPGTGLHYSIFDLNLNNGLGDIDLNNKNKPLYIPLSDFAADKLTSIRHKNNKDIWIITRSFPGQYFYSFLLTSNGIQPIAKISNSLVYVNTWEESEGEIAISPDGYKMCSAYIGNNDMFEYGNFNTETGIYTPLFSISPSPVFGHSDPFGLEFSPDSKLLYCCFPHTSLDYTPIYQYDAQQVDSTLFRDSELLIGYGIGSTLQTAPDNKIYGGIIDRTKISVIQNPNGRGDLCNYSFESVDLEDKKMGSTLPQMIQKYFAYFNVQHLCANQPVEFTSNIWPLPDSVYWNFGDAASGSMDTCSLINPAHIYDFPGNYQVTLIAYWPGDRSVTTIKSITIGQQPNPALGADKEICLGGSTTLISAPFDSYQWITGENSQSIIVADTGVYWVEVTNAEGCIGRDSVRVDYFAPPVLNTDSLVISPTTCGGSRGAITGLTATGADPVNVEWRDGYNNFIATGYDLINMPVGNYYLWSTDGNGCTNLLGQYYIRDAGDVLIDTVKSTPSYCGSNNGTITIRAVSGLGEKLQYSVDDGGSWSNDSIFTNLSPAIPYFIRVRVIDTTGCQAVFEFNPVTIADLPGPEVTATSEPEKDNNADGKITITATGFGTLTYILENGTPQDSGVFTGLQAGLYHYRVEDQNGCFVEDSIRVEHLQGFILSAIAGNDTICSTQTLHIPVMVDNFNGIRSFKAVMKYEAQKVTCHGYMAGSINNQLPGISIIDFPAIQEIVATWSDSSSVTLQGMEQLFTLVFTPNETGISGLTWDQAPGKSYFEGDNGLIDNVQLVPGQMQVNDPAAVSIGYEPAVCEGEMLIIAPVFSGTAPMVYQWQKPDGGTDTRDMIFQPFAGEEHSGEYRIKVTDALGCSDSAVITARVVPPPSANFPETPIPFENQYTLKAPQGYHSYEWSNGETNYFITVAEEGEYSIIIKTTEGCESRDTAMLVNVAVPVYVPNAFTPNGDGLNDTFKPIITKPDLVSQYHLSIYNRWGQCFFETSDLAKGWDGKNELQGVYNWVVSYRDGMGKVNQLKGLVTLIK